MNCSRCGEHNTDDALFCAACGAPLHSHHKAEAPQIIGSRKSVKREAWKVYWKYCLPMSIGHLVTVTPVVILAILPTFGITQLAAFLLSPMLEGAIAYDMNALHDKNATLLEFMRAAFDWKRYPARYKGQLDIVGNYFRSVFSQLKRLSTKAEYTSLFRYSMLRFFLAIFSDMSEKAACNISERMMEGENAALRVYVMLFKLSQLPGLLALVLLVKVCHWLVLPILLAGVPYYVICHVVIYQRAMAIKVGNGAFRAALVQEGLDQPTRC